MGSYIIKNVPSGVKFDLKAANGEVIATSEVYSGEAACEKGVESVRKFAADAPIEDQTVKGFTPEKHPKFEVYQDKAEEFRFRLKASNGEILVFSEGYTTKNNCLNGIASVKKNAPDSPVKRIE